jgi:hypothetical protein
MCLRTRLTFEPPHPPSVSRYGNRSSVFGAVNGERLLIVGQKADLQKISRFARSEDFTLKSLKKQVWRAYYEIWELKGGERNESDKNEEKIDKCEPGFYEVLVRVVLCI